MNLASQSKFPSRQTARGSALLAVLWLSAALAAIAMSVAYTVRGETARVTTNEEDVRAYYLAEGAIQRAILYVEWSQSGRTPDGETKYFVTGQPQMTLRFPSGDAVVDVIPETSKISLNLAKPDLLAALLQAVGADPDRAALVASAIVDWRTPHSLTEPTGFDQVYLSLQPSFHAAHASFQDVEELLYLQGMTPDLFYGTWVRQNDDQGSRLVEHPALRDCVSVFGSLNRFDVNTVQPAVLAAIGAAPEQIQSLVERRRAAPILQPQEFADLAQSDPSFMSHLTIAQHTLYTFRATARMRRPDGSLSDMKRVVSAMVKFLPVGSSDKPFHVLRWYDHG
jgi:general secretion pathway protein K